jgi:hypothetical protein
MTRGAPLSAAPDGSGPGAAEIRQGQLRDRHELPETEALDRPLHRQLPVAHGRSPAASSPADLDNGRSPGHHFADVLLVRLGKRHP